MSISISNAEVRWTSNPNWEVFFIAPEPNLEWMIINFDDVEYRVPITGLSEFSWQPPPGTFTEGAHTIAIRFDDLAGNPGESLVYVITLDTTAPDQPRILYADDDVGPKTDFIKNNGRTDDENPLLVGLAERNGLVKIFDAQDRLIGSVQADDNGFWEIELPLGKGEHALYVTATDKMGHESVPSAPFNIAIGPDESVPEPVNALITSAWDDSGNATGWLANGALTDDTAPTLHGTGPINGTVEIQYRTAGGDWLTGGTANVLANGSWSWEAPELDDGSWTFRASASPDIWSDEFVLEIDRTPLDRLTIDRAWDDQGSWQGPLGSGAMTDDHTPTFHGRAEANSLVYLHYRTVGGNWTRFGSIVAEHDGSWTLTGSMLPNGDFEFAAGADRTSPGDDPDRFMLTIVDDDLLSPQITGVYDDVGAVQQYLTNPGVTDDRTPRLEGRAPVGALVVIYQDDTVIGSVLAENGLWQFDVPALADETSYRFSSALRSDNGDGPKSTEWVVDLVTSGSVEIDIAFTSMTRDSGLSASDWITNDGEAGRTISGTLSRALAQGERLMVHNGSEWLLAAVNGPNWTVVDNSVHSSSWLYQAKVENAVIGADSAVADQAVTFDNQIVTPVISGIYDNSASGAPVLVPGNSTTRDTTPLLKGTAEAGSLVYIYREGITAPVGSIVAHNGQWQFTSASLGAGSQTFYVNAKDTAGNEAQSNRYKINIIAYQSIWNFDDLSIGSVVGPLNYKGMHILGGFTQIAASLDPINKHNLLSYRSISLTFNSDISSLGIDLQRANSAVTLSAFNRSGNKIFEKVVYTTGSLTDYHFDFPSNVAKITLSHQEYLRIDNISVSYAGRSLNDITNIDDALQPHTSVPDISAIAGKSTLHLAGGEDDDIQPFRINMATLLGEGTPNLFIENGKTQLLITGDENDTVQLDDLLPDGTDTGDWIAQNGTVTVAGVEYQVFSHSGEEAEVLIQQGIKTELI